MPEISFYELILIAIVGLLVIGPERLPETLRTLGLWFGRMRRSFNAVKTEIEKEIGMDEVRRQLHNEAVMDQMKQLERDVKGTLDEARIDDPSIAHPGQGDTNTASEEDAAATAEAQDETPHLQQTEPPASDEDHPEEPPKRRPPTEAEVEAAYERERRRAEQD